MRFTPKTEQEIASENLLPAGEYFFEIAEATNEISRAGNEMIKLTLNVYADGSDRPRMVFDYLMEKVAYKLRNAAQACGLLDAYNKGSLDAEDFVMRAGKCKIGIRKDKNGEYPDRNIVVDYMRAEPKKGTSTKQKVAAGDLDDEIPF